MSVNCFGLIFNGLTKEELFSLSQNRFVHVVTVNAEFIVEAQNNLHLKDIINNNFSTLDGQVPFFIFSLIRPHCKVEKISGSDLIYDVSNIALREQKKVFLLGGTVRSNFDAVLKLRKLGLLVDGFSPEYSEYPFSESLNNSILKSIEAFRPDYIFVGFGMGKQEFWINDNRNWLSDNNIKIAVGCGGTFDFVSGQISRAPLWIQKMGFESIFRFASEPKLFRLKRIFRSFLFFKYIFK